MDKHMDKNNGHQFIVLEGLDGSGKTTLTKMLAARLKEENQPCTTSFAPTNSPMGRLMRSILSAEAQDVENEAVALLLASDRYQHIKTEILPALLQGHVVCDRYYYSSMAYQGEDDNTLARIISYNQSAMGIRRPDIVFYLNVSPEECMRRIAKRGGEHNIFDDLQELKLRESRYLAAFRALTNEETIVKVGNDQLSLEEMLEEIMTHLRKSFA